MSGKKYRALFISDWHLSNTLPHSKPLPGSDVTDRFQAQLNMMDDLGDRADLEGIRDIYILGDFYDKPVLDTVTLRESTKGLMRLASNGRRVFIGAGNHESPTVKGGNYVSEFIQHLPNENIIYMDHGFEIAPEEWLKFWWVPWGPLVESVERIEEIQVKAIKSKAQTVLLLHHSVDGCTHGGWKCDDGLDPDWLTEDFDAVFSGHFHDAQEFGSCGLYLGSPLQLHFGDCDGRRVFFDVTFEPGEKAVATACQTTHAKFLQYEVEGPEGIQHDGKAKPKDYVRFNVKCTSEEWTKNRTAIATAIAKVAEESGANVKSVHRPVAKTTMRLGADSEGMEYGAMLKKWVEIAKPEGLSKARLSEIGAAALAAAKAEEKL